MCFFKFNVEPVELDQRHPDQAFGNLRFLEKFLIGYHAQSLLALYQLRHTSILAPFSAILAPLVEFQFITDNVIKFIIYLVLVVSVLATSIPNILNLIPERSRTKHIRDTIIMGLDLICSILNSHNPAKYRACIFMLTNKKSKVLTIEFNSSNMDDSKDLDIKLEKHQGCTGTAWAKRKPIVSDLTIVGKNGGAQWGLTEKQIIVTKNLKAVISIPIYRPKSRTIIAILSIDSVDKVAKYFLKPLTQELAASYASIFANLLLSIDEPHPLK